MFTNSLLSLLSNHVIQPKNSLWKFSLGGTKNGSLKKYALLLLCMLPTMTFDLLFERGKNAARFHFSNYNPKKLTNYHNIELNID